MKCDYNCDQCYIHVASMPVSEEELTLTGRYIYFNIKF